MDSQTAPFIAHNKKIWGDYANDHAKGEVLFEVNAMHSAVISYSYLANILAKRHDAQITGYVLGDQKRGERYFPPAHHSVYASFNTRRIVYSRLTRSQSETRDRYLDSILPTLKTKKDVEDLAVDGVWIGPLVYDSHLMAHRVPTVDIKDPRFRDSLRASLGDYVFWRDYFDSHDVKAVNVSHCVYNNAIILRLATHRGIPAYQINATRAYHLTNKHLWAYDEFFYFPEEFRELSPVQQRKGLREAQNRLAKRFAGEVGVDMPYSTKSAYVGTGRGRVLRKSPRLKVFVPLHCFFDSPHTYGVNLFTDFFEWLTFLGNISERTDYEWYLKTHPDYLPGNLAIIEGFLERYPKFTLLPSDTCHHQIIQDGVDCALTVYGTIGFEYAALGVPVINASTCNPHIAYNFNIHPTSIEDYERILMNLHDLASGIDVNDVYEYYYMKFMNNVDNWLFSDYQGLLDTIGGYRKQFTTIVYSAFLREFSQLRHDRILSVLSRFIDSKDYTLGRRHGVPPMLTASAPLVAASRRAGNVMSVREPQGMDLVK